MADYNYDPNDGKLHVRYSQLIRCTPHQVDRLIAEMEGLERVETENMLEGTLRHEMFAREAQITQKPYYAFNLNWRVTHVEHEFASEILPGVIVHSRPDIVCADIQMLPDYKTVLDGTHGWRETIKQYHHTSKQRQLQFYAFQLGLHGILIREGSFLCEIWNKERDTILGYEVIRFPITLGDMAAALAWARPKVALLVSALEQRASIIA